jgi:signal peptidase II
MSRVESPPPVGSETAALKAGLYGSALAFIVVLDQVTKYVAQQTLPPYEPVPVLGDFFRLTYIYNPGAAFGLHVGELSRWVFLGLTVVALVVLALWFRATPAHDRLRLAAITIISGGAIGNFIDRARSPRGVVDFFDFGFGNVRWPVFNVADIAVTTGAVLLAISLWKEEQEAERERG